MNRTFTYTIDELPLVVEGGLTTGLVSGSAEISYFRDGEWGVESISIDADRLATPDELANGSHRYISRLLSLDRGTPIFSLIHDRLEREWFSYVQDAVNSQIEDDRECAAGDRADMRRDELMLER